MAQGNAIRVLLVEDDPADVLLIREALAEARDCRFEIESVPRLSTALHELASDGFDVVLLDLCLPDSRGLDTLRAVRASVPGAGIVVLTGLDDPALGMQLVQEGAQDYLVKGQARGEFLARSLRYALERKHGERDLRESEARYRSLVELAPEITYLLNAKGEILFISQAVKTLGYRPEDLVGKNFCELLCPDDAARGPQRFVERRTGDRITRNLELRLKAKGHSSPREQKRSLPVSLSARGVWDVPDDQINRQRKSFLGTQGMISDITERKQTEETLLRHLHTLSAMVTATADLSLETDADSLCRQAVEIGRNLLGLERLGIWLADAAVPNVRGTFGTDAEGRTRDERHLRFPVGPDSPMGRILQGAAQVEVRHEQLESGRGTGWLILAPLVAHQKKTIGILSADSLFSDKPFDEYTIWLVRLYGIAVGHLLHGLRSEDAWRESQAIFRTLAETGAVILFLVQGEQFAYVNTAAEAFFGYSPEEFSKMNFWEVVHPDMQEMVKARARARQRNDPVPAQYEIKVLAKNGQELWMDFRGSRIELNGAPAVLGAALDITARKRTEQELKEYAERQEVWRATQAQLETARHIQQEILPAAPPVLKGLDIGGATYPADATGGDFFDFIRLRGGEIGLVVGDATGHGLGPALIAAETCAYLRALALKEPDLGKVMADANSLLAGNIGAGNFIALFFAVLDPVQRTLTYASAGQASSYVLDAAGRLKATLESTELPLGVDPQNRFPVSPVIGLLPGEMVCLLSDGLQDAMSRGGELFGTQRILDRLQAHRSQGAREIVEALYAEACAYSGHAALVDDITVIVVKVGELPA